MMINLTADYNITQDIDCTNMTLTTRIGDNFNPFNGSLSGNGFKIFKFTAFNSVGLCGLISYAKGATIKGIVFEDAIVSTSTSDVGIVCGVAENSFITNITIKSSSDNIKNTVNGNSGRCGGRFFNF